MAEHPQTPAPAPGDRLREILERRDMSQTELAERTGRPVNAINDMIHGRLAITADTALQLERALGVPAATWNALESAWQDHLARRREEEMLAADAGWLDELPVAEMTAAGWCERGATPAEQARLLLDFFAVASPQGWRRVYLAPQAGYYATPALEIDPGALAAWLRAGEIRALATDCAPWDRKAFQRVLAALPGWTQRGMTAERERLIAMCAGTGVALAFTRSLAGLPVQAATRWLSPRKALIQLSELCGSEADTWAMFCQQAAHLLLHGKKQVFVEGEEGEHDGHNPSDAELLAADASIRAEDTLLPSSRLDLVLAALRHEDLDESLLTVLAARLGIGPGVLLHRLEYEGWILKGRFDELKGPPVAMDRVVIQGRK